MKATIKVGITPCDEGFKAHVSCKQTGWSETHIIPTEAEVKERLAAVLGKATELMLDGIVTGIKAVR